MSSVPSAPNDVAVFCKHPIKVTVTLEIGHSHRTYWFVSNQGSRRRLEAIFHVKQIPKSIGYRAEGRLTKSNRHEGPTA